MQQQIAQGDATRFQKLDQIGRSMAEFFEKAGAATATWHRSQQGMASEAQAFQQAVVQLQQTLIEHGRLFHELSQQQLQGAPQHFSAELQNSVAELATQIGRFTHWLDGAQPQRGDGQDKAPAIGPPLTMPPSPPLTMPRAPSVTVPLSEAPLVAEPEPAEARTTLWRRIFNR